VADVIPLVPDPDDEHDDHDAGQQSPGEATDLGRVLLDLADATQRLLVALAEIPAEQLRALTEDPLPRLIDLGDRVGVDWPGTVAEMTDYVRTRLSGDYAVDEFGFDPKFTTVVVLPFLRRLARSWFRVEVRGAENLPTDSAALLVSNHAGTLPVDALMLQTAVYDAIGRHTRTLGADLVFATPYIGDLSRKIGVTMACQEDAERLLSTGQLVSVYPEGFKGLGKLYSERYQLQRFGRGGFVSAAVRAQVPIVPVSIVGSEEIYPQVAQLPALARLLDLPYFPVTPLFPLLGVLGMIPLPSKWIIQIGEQIATDALPVGAADDPMITFEVTDQVRETIQHTLHALLLERPGVFG
jgi:1-acyl-sn-glycerol-3-phosphate acyltransferase